MQFRRDSSSTSSLSILIVDSDAETAATTQAAASREGHHCRVITTATEALALLAHERFDIVLVEATLADGSGATLLRSLERGSMDFLLAALLGHAHDDANRIEAIEVVSRGDQSAAAWLVNALTFVRPRKAPGRA